VKRFERLENDHVGGSACACVIGAGEGFRRREWSVAGGEIHHPTSSGLFRGGFASEGMTSEGSTVVDIYAGETFGHHGKYRYFYQQYSNFDLEQCCFHGIQRTSLQGSYVEYTMEASRHM
jgi:hypothetical protein